METFQEWFNNNNISDLFTPSVEDSEDALIALACEKQWDDIALILREVFKLPPVKAVFFKSYLIKRTQKNDDKHEEKDPNDDKLSSKSLATNSNTNVSHGNTDILNAINTNTNVSLATNSNTNVSHGNTDIDEKKKNKMTTQQAMDRSKKGQTNKENWERPCWSERKQLPFVHLVMVHATFLLSFMVHAAFVNQLVPEVKIDAEYMDDLIKKKVLQHKLRFQGKYDDWTLSDELELIELISSNDFVGFNQEICKQMWDKLGQRHNPDDIRSKFIEYGIPFLVSNEEK
eukprot:278901_1